MVEAGGAVVSTVTSQQAAPAIRNRDTVKTQNLPSYLPHNFCNTRTAALLVQVPVIHKSCPLKERKGFTISKSLLLASEPDIFHSLASIVSFFKTSISISSFSSKKYHLTPDTVFGVPATGKRRGHARMWPAGVAETDQTRPPRSALSRFLNLWWRPIREKQFGVFKMVKKSVPTLP